MTGKFALRVAVENGIPYMEPVDHFGPEELGVAEMETQQAVQTPSPAQTFRIACSLGDHSVKL